jgi:hypothetical protein
MKIEQFKELRAKGLNLDLVYILEKINEREKLPSDNIIEVLALTLQRKGYAFEGKITTEGRELLESLKEKKVKTKKVVKYEDEFTKWWKTYPGTTEFTYKSRHFPGSRAIRINKEGCKSKFERIIDEGVSGEDMVKALEKEIEQKKEESIKTGQNKLNYMQNSLTYLNQRTFEPYLELIKKEPESQSKNTIDI